MYIRHRILLAVAMLLILINATGCVTWYYKRFAVSASPPDFQNVFNFGDFNCGFGIDANPNRSRSLTDSSYAIWICISVNDSINCDGVWDSLIGTLEIANSRLLFDQSTAILRFSEKEFGRHRCHKCWDSKNITIPDAVDTVVLELHLSYLKDGSQIVADTAVELYRFQGKQKHMISF